MRVQRVLAQDVRDFSSRRAVQQYIAQREVRGKIENGGNAGVHAVPTAMAAGEKGSYSRVRMKYFADRCQIRINGVETGVPGGPELPRDIGKGVDTKTIETGSFRPPEGVLQKISC